MESPHLCQVCEIKEQNNIVHDQVLRERMQTTETKFLGRIKQILAGEWQSMGEKNHEKEFHSSARGMWVGGKDWASWQKDQKTSKGLTIYTSKGLQQT